MTNDTVYGALSLGLCCAASVMWPAHALAEGAQPAPTAAPQAARERSGGSGDVRLSVGGMLAEHGLNGRTLSELSAVSVDAGLRVGGFATEHLYLGYELAGGYHIGVGDPDIVTAGAYSDQPRPRRGEYTMFAPLGMFFEVYPFSGYGVYAGVSGGIGFMDMPAYVEEGGGAMAHYAFELGYDLSGTGKWGLGAFVCYQRWLGATLVDPGSDFDSQGVNLGARWSLF